MGEKSIDLPTAGEDEGHKRRFDAMVSKAKRESSAKATTKPDQYQEFVRAAREVGADEGQGAFDNMLRRIASAPPPKSVQKRKSGAKRRRKSK